MTVYSQISERSIVETNKKSPVYIAVFYNEEKDSYTIKKCFTIEKKADNWAKYNHCFVSCYPINCYVPE